MAEVQKYVNKFNNKIRLSYDDDASLRSKRDLLISVLQNGLKKKMIELNLPITHRKFDFFNQGSYYMRTGIQPLIAEDYDIDIGLMFHFSRYAYTSPQVKTWIYDILKIGARHVEIKRPCVRVQYHNQGEKAYHIDLAIYVHPDYNEGQTYIAKGFSGSLPQYKIWEISEPHKMKAVFDAKLPNLEDREQFRRVIRLFKKWKDVNFAESGSERPTGIALTACVMKWFNVEKQYNIQAGGFTYIDIRALKNVINQMLNYFSTWSKRLEIQLPVKPNNDLFEKMGEAQMQRFKIKLQKLRDNLAKADTETSQIKALYLLQEVFGNEFPIN